MIGTRVLIGGIALAVVLSGCSAAVDKPDTGRLSIVASTDVYGSIASAIGGDLVDITSILDDPSQDPHSFEANARVQLELSKADIVIENGGGYDGFVDSMLSGAGNPNAVVLTVTDISGVDQHPATGEFNEHLWYSLDAVGKLSSRLEAALVAAEPASAETFAANAAAFRAGLDVLGVNVAALKEHSHGMGVIVTEPVPLYLLTEAGFDNVTPPAFSASVEEGTDVAPAVLQETLGLIRDGTARLVVYNSQTSGAETNAVREAAQELAIPVFGVTETLPAGETGYLHWMQTIIQSLQETLAG